MKRTRWRGVILSRLHSTRKQLEIASEAFFKSVEVSGKNKHSQFPLKPLLSRITCNSNAFSQANYTSFCTGRPSR